MFSQMLAAGVQHSSVMTHGLSELTASAVWVKLAPFRLSEKKRVSEGQEANMQISAEEYGRFSSKRRKDYMLLYLG